MKKFQISGEFRIGSEIRKFTKEVEAETAEHARELLLANLGSKHGTARRFINVMNIVEAEQTSVILDAPDANNNSD